jgi:hypothetical protein
MGVTEVFPNETALFHGRNTFCQKCFTGVHTYPLLSILLLSLLYVSIDILMEIGRDRSYWVLVTTPLAWSLYECLWSWCASLICQCLLPFALTVIAGL